MANVRIYINNSKKGKDILSIGLDEEEKKQKNGKKSLKDDMEKMQVNKSRTNFNKIVQK